MPPGVTIAAVLLYANCSMRTYASFLDDRPVPPFAERMRGWVRRYLVVLVRFFPFALAFLRDRRRFVLFGSRRHVSDERHRRRGERIRGRLLELGPAFVKVGRVLSTRPDIVPPMYADAFGTLQDEVPEEEGGDPRDVVVEALGDELDMSTLEPIAGGSLGRFIRHERRSESACRSIRLPEAVDTENVPTRMKNGVLTVTLPRLVAEEARGIEIELE